MELKYQFMIYIGIVLGIAFLLFYFLKKTKKKVYEDGRKLASAYILEEEPYYRRKIITYKVVSVLVLVSLVGAIVSSCVLLARPHKSHPVTENKYSRDIMLVIDISSSVDYLNRRIIQELIDTVRNLKNERFGIVIFNTSPVLISPLTDDYEYTIEQLEKIDKALDMRAHTKTLFLKIPEDYLYYSEFITGGTLVGNEQRGSSLIGDGLASCVFHFSKKESERTKVVIFTTDNDPQGEEMVDLIPAAELCKKNDIVVYGVGTKEMRNADMDEMKQAVELTGGSFYVEEESGSFASIVSDIEEKSVNLVEGNHYVVEKEYPQIAFLFLLISIVCLFGFLKYTKR